MINFGHSEPSKNPKNTQFIISLVTKLEYVNSRQQKVEYLGYLNYLAENETNPAFSAKQSIIRTYSL